MKKNFVLIGLFAFVFFSVNTFAKDLVFLAEDYPPYEWEKNGKSTGFDSDTIREICKRLGYNAVFKYKPWKRCLVEIEKGQADAIYSLMNTEERRNYILFPNEPLSVEKNVIFASKGKELKINTIEDLKLLKIGVQPEYSYGKEFDNYKGLNKEKSNNVVELLKKLEKGRMDVAICNEAVAFFKNKELGLKPIETLYVVSEDPLFIGFSKAKGLEELTQKVSQVLSDMRKEGIIVKIQSKYQ